MKKRLFAFIFCALLMSSLAAAHAFSDVPNKCWARDYITQMTNEGVLGGYSDGTFRPEAIMTRGEFAAVFAKSVGFELTNASSIYLDANNHWAKQYIVAVSDYMDGTTATQFEPDRPVTREVVAAALGQIQGWAMAEMNTAVGGELFSDFNQADPKYQDDILRAVALGVTDGYPDGTFKPKGELTRAEACAMVYRAFHYEIDTIAANLEDFRSLVITNTGTVYYMVGDTIFNTESDNVLDLNTSFGDATFYEYTAWGGKKFINAYLAYDSYHHIVYLVAEDNPLSLYDITDFNNPELVLNETNCPALSELEGPLGGLKAIDTQTPQIPILENGALLVPNSGPLNGDWMINPNTKVVTRTSDVFPSDGYTCVLGDTYIKFNGDSQLAKVVNIGDDLSDGYQIQLEIEAPRPHMISRNGLVYFYKQYVGLCAFTIDGTAYVIID